MSLVCVSLQLKFMSLSRNSMCSLHCPGSCHAEHWHVGTFYWGLLRDCVPGVSVVWLCHRQIPVIYYVNSLWKFKILITKNKYLYRYMMC